jgi:hypothetical protein
MFGSYKISIEIIKGIIAVREKQAQNAMDDGDDRKARRLIAGIVELYELITIFQQAHEEAEKEHAEFYNQNPHFLGEDGIV